MVFRLRSDLDLLWPRFVVYDAAVNFHWLWKEFPLPMEKAFYRDIWCHSGAALQRKHLDWSSILQRIAGLLHDVAMPVFAHASPAEKHFIEMTERSFHRGFPLSVWMLSDGGQYHFTKDTTQYVCTSKTQLHALVGTPVHNFCLSHHYWVTPLLVLISPAG